MQARRAWSSGGAHGGGSQAHAHAHGGRHPHQEGSSHGGRTCGGGGGKGPATCAQDEEDGGGKTGGPTMAAGGVPACLAASPGSPRTVGLLRLRQGTRRPPRS